MAESVGQIGLDLVVNRNGFDKQMNNITGIAKKAAGVLAATFAIKGLINFGKQCLELGSDLAEVQNVVDVTFNSMSKQVDDFAKGAAMSFGLSETMAKKYVGTFGAMSKAFGFNEKAAYDMSTALTGLSGDVASFYNISQDEAYTKLKSVFTGETESLKDLGVVMTQTALDQFALSNGFNKVTKDMTEQEKVALRFAFVQQQLALASGDFSRTSDSWANQTRILKLQFDSLKASLGQGFIAILTPVIKVINTIMGKLVQLANVFKSFVESITGKKSESPATGMQQVASAAVNASGATDNIAKSTGKAAKKAKQLQKSLMGFDEINNLTKPTADDDSGDIGGGSLGGGQLPSAGMPDMSKPLNEANAKMNSLIQRAKELFSIFKQGFNEGLGKNFDKSVSNIKTQLAGIREGISSIFNDTGVQSGMTKMQNSFSKMLGRISGSVVRNFTTIFDFITGSFNKFFKSDGNKISKRLADTFNVKSQIFDKIGEIFVGLSDIYDVYGGENAKKLGGNIIGGIVQGLMGAEQLLSRALRDILSLVFDPIIQNSANIKQVIDETLGPIAEVLGTFKQGISDTMDALIEIYDTSVKPLLDSIKQTVTDMVTQICEQYHTYIAPVLQEWGERFRKLYDEHLKPLLDNLKELFKKVFEIIKWGWDNIIGPFITWIATSIIPKVAPVFKFIGDVFLTVFQTISDVVNSITEIINGLLDFIIGVFTGDWERAWNGVREVFEGIWDGMVGIVKGPINLIIDAVNYLIGKLNKISFDVPDWVPIIGGNTWGFTIPEIPHLATGGYVKANQPQLAMIGDNKTQGEIVAPEGKMMEVMTQALSAFFSKMEGQGSSNNNSGNGDLTVELHMDGNKMGDVIVKSFRKLEKKTGKVLLPI